MADFFYMGGYGAYIWASYWVAGVLIASMVMASLHAHGRLQQTLAQFPYPDHET